MLIMIVGGFIRDFEKAENYSVKTLLRYYGYIEEGRWLQR